MTLLVTCGRSTQPGSDYSSDERCLDAFSAWVVHMLITVKHGYDSTLMVCLHISTAAQWQLVHCCGRMHHYRRANHCVSLLCHIGQHDRNTQCFMYLVYSAE
jgi:hypothetical protein